MEGELIFLGFIMLIGQIILLQMWNNNWFKKENFKIEKSNVLAKNKLSLRKLEQEMGLTKSKTIVPAETPSTIETISGLLPLLKSVDPERIGDLIDHFIGEGESVEGAAAGDPISMVMSYAKRNPEMVDGVIGFLKGLGAGNEGQEIQSQV